MLCLTDLNGGDRDDIEHTDEWINLINRGGLWRVSDEVYQLFLIMESAVKERMNLHVTPTAGSHQEIVDSLMSNEDLLFQWCFCATDLQDETARGLLKQIVELFVTTRAYGYTLSCLEIYKNANKKTLSKRKALRTELNCNTTD